MGSYDECAVDGELVSLQGWGPAGPQEPLHLIAKTEVFSIDRICLQKGDAFNACEPGKYTLLICVQGKAEFFAQSLYKLMCDGQLIYLLPKEAYQLIALDSTLIVQVLVSASTLNA